MADEQIVVVTDSTVIINFLHIGKLELVSQILNYRFLVPEHVVTEITRADQRSALEAEFQAGRLNKVLITELDVLQSYAELRKVLGSGESACLALAQHRGYRIASDEKKAFRRLATERLGADGIVTTERLIVCMIRAGLAAVAEADQWKAVLEQHQFTLDFASFAERLGIEDR